MNLFQLGFFLKTNKQTNVELKAYVKLKNSIPGGSEDKESACNAGDTGAAGLIPESGRSPGGGNGNSLQYFCLENSMNRGAWQASVHGVTKSQTRLRDSHTFKCFWIESLNS